MLKLKKESEYVHAYISPILKKLFLFLFNFQLCTALEESVDFVYRKRWLFRKDRRVRIFKCFTVDLFSLFHGS